MAKVEIRCPSCNKRGNIEIAEDIINQSARGVTAINIPQDQICTHSFVAYIDKNLAVRDCFMADFQLELPQMEIEQPAEKEIPDASVADVDLIKINVPALTLTYFIRASLLNRNIFPSSKTNVCPGLDSSICLRKSAILKQILFSLNLGSIMQAI